MTSYCLSYFLYC